ncbi:amino acid ABC transporter permease [Variovorax paradoxus]|uniref:amino acid ABC transporter permease n=1 Tax=Variovorax paradoxus TaxID=34073 RepID=UPI000361A029|nr:amino acid ABC transporter permease [Variovorax paradoxus]
MDYAFQFGSVWAALPRLAEGARLTIMLSLATIGVGLVIGIVCALARTSHRAWLRWPASIYVEAIRNTPFLIQLFLIYFGLPSLGLRLDPVEAALIGMSINCGAYATEIVRAGIDAIPRGQLEAARALGFPVPSIVRHVVLFPALRAVFPALASQFILVMLGSAVVSTVSVEELTGVAHLIETENFRPFEVYLVVTAMYLAIAFSLKLIFAAIDRFYFQTRGHA